MSLDYLCGRTDRMRGTIMCHKIQDLSPVQWVNDMITIMRRDYEARGNAMDERNSERTGGLKKTPAHKPASGKEGSKFK